MITIPTPWSTTWVGTEAGRSAAADRFIVARHRPCLSARDGEPSDASVSRRAPRSRSSEADVAFVRHYAESGTVGHDERPRSGNTETLRVVDADHLQDGKCFYAFYALRNRRDAHYSADLIDCLDHCAIDRIARNIADKHAVNLQMVDRQMLQVAERRHPAAEIVQGKAAAEHLQLVDEPRRPGEARDRSCFSDLEADRLVGNSERLELRADEWEKIVLVQRRRRQVDGPSMRLDWPFPRDDSGEFLKAGRDHEPIYGRHQVVALRDRNEGHGIHDPAPFVDHAHQQFLVTLAFSNCRHGDDFLRVQAKPTFMQREA